MPKMRNYFRSFAGGEISPEMFGRIDDAKFQTGAATVRNFITTPTGAAKNRPGFAYVSATKGNGVARLIPFTYSAEQTMVVELGNQYARFHTMGETLLFDSADAVPWRAPSPALTYTLTTPAVFTWTAHGLTTGQAIRFYAPNNSSGLPIPTGLQLAYTYTVNVLDANTFQILDGGNAVALGGGSGGGSFTPYTGTGTANVSATAYASSLDIEYSNILGGLANVAVGPGVATLNATIAASVVKTGGGFCSIAFQYSTNGTTWITFRTATASLTTAVSVSIPITNLDTLQLRVMASCFTGGAGEGAEGVAGGGPGSGATASGAASISAWSIDVPTGGSSGTFAPIEAYLYYSAGAVASYGGNYYAAVVSDTGGITTPGTDAGAIWRLLPSNLAYEIATPYAAADLFAIHYTQSSDVMTLVHPNYAPMELSRESATQWSLTPIVFGPPLNTPEGAAVAATPGYKATIASITLASPAVFTTVSNHTLSEGDGVYIENLTATIGGTPTPLDGFYMVEKIPVDGSGNLIPNQLILMDYSGNTLSASGFSAYSSGATIQYGTQIFNITNLYAVQAIASDGVTTSALSASASVLNNLDVTGSYNTVSWSAVNGAQSYNVYKQFNGLWGYIGNTTALSFVDNNIAVDLSITPGYPDSVFSGSGNYPAAVCYFQQRRCFAGTSNAPQNAWMSNSGTESMFSYSLPSLSTDRIAFRVAALQADAIQHLVPMVSLILLTSETEFALGQPGTYETITPSSLSVNAQSYIGASSVQPTVINTTMVYAASRGGHVRELGYAWTVNGYQTGDLSLRASHLFDNLTIVDQAYSKSPLPIVWFVSSNGQLLGLTYIPEEQIGAWHHHDTQGTFESITCVHEGNEDVLYAVINRTIGGSTVRYVERLATRLFDTLADAFFVDAGASFSNETPVTEISGLTWLEGQTVSVLADGGVQSQKVVTGGSITLDAPASVVQVGLPYVSQLETLPAVLQLDGYGQGRVKNINRCWVKVYQSSGIFVGPDADHLTEIKQRTTEPWASPPALQTGELAVLTTPSWQESGQVCIQQQNPLPVDVVGLTMEVVLGD